MCGGGTTIGNHCAENRLAAGSVVNNEQTADNRDNSQPKSPPFEAIECQTGIRMHFLAKLTCFDLHKTQAEAN